MLKFLSRFFPEGGGGSKQWITVEAGQNFKDSNSVLARGEFCRRLGYKRVEIYDLILVCVSTYC